MSKKSPQIGEVWAGDNFSSKVHLVVGTTPNITLLDRHQTCTSISPRSFDIIGKFILASLKETCSSCEAGAIVFGLDKRPYCFEHRPRHQVLYFPGDLIDKDPLLWGDLKCPTCKIPLTDTVTIERSLMVASCECLSTFTPLILRSLYKENSNDIDPKLLTEWLSLALEIIREHKHTQLWLYAPYTASSNAWSLISSAFSKKVSEINSECVSRSVVCTNGVIPYPFIFVGGSHELSPEEEDVRHQKLYPGSLWVSRKGDEFLRVVRMSCNPPGSILCLGLKDPEVYKELREDTLREEFKRTLQKDLTFECIPGQKYNPNPLKVPPSVGDTWYNVKELAYRRVLQVSEETVKFSLTSNKAQKVKYLATLDEFLWEHDASEEHKHWKIGSLYQYGDDQYGELLNFDTVQVKLSYEGASKTIPVRDFRGAKAVILRSVLDRLMDEA